MRRIGSTTLKICGGFFFGGTGPATSIPEGDLGAMGSGMTMKAAIGGTTTALAASASGSYATGGRQTGYGIG